MILKSIKKHKHSKGLKVVFAIWISPKVRLEVDLWTEAFDNLA